MHFTVDLIALFELLSRTETFYQCFQQVLSVAMGSYSIVIFKIILYMLLVVGVITTTNATTIIIIIVAVVIVCM
jgi:hypothetical protein